MVWCRAGTTVAVAWNETDNVGTIAFRGSSSLQVSHLLSIRSVIVHDCTSTGQNACKLIVIATFWLHLDLGHLLIAGVRMPESLMQACSRH